MILLIKEIGGYPALELSQKEHAFHKGALQYQSARDAFTALLQNMPRVRRVWMPTYICDSMLAPIKFIGKECVFYNIDKQFNTTNEIQLKEEGIDYKMSDFPLTANGKALTEGSAEGSLRIYSDKKYGQVLGVQIVAEHATDMIAEAAAYMSIEGTIYDVAQTIHAHPTISEIFMEAAFDAVDKAIHK